MPSAFDPLFWRNTTILSVIEAAYAEDAVPGSANALRILEATLKVMDGGTIDRKYVRSYMGAAEKTHVGVHRTAKIVCELSGSGTAGIVAGYSPLLRSCAMGELVRPAANTIQASPGTPAGGNTGAMTYVVGATYTGAVSRTVTITCTTAGASGAAKVTVAAPAGGGAAAYSQTNVTVTSGTPLALPGGASVTPTMTADFGVGDVWTIAVAPALTQYHPVSDDFEASSNYFYRGGQLRRLLGTRGNAIFSFAEKDVPKISFDVKGIWSPPVTQAPPLAAPAGFHKGLVVSKANTPLARLHGVDIVLKSLEINLGATPNYKDRPNQAAVLIGDHPVSGTIEFQYPKLADFDVETVAHDDILGTLELVHGTTPGNIVQLDAGRVQITEPDWQEEDGIIMCRANLTLPPSDAGNDDVVLTIR